MNKKYKHIFFDLDNTLWDFEANSATALNLTFSHFKLEDKGIIFNEFLQVYRIHNERLWESYRNNGVTKHELIRQRFQDTFDDFGIGETDPVEFNTIFLELMPHQKLLVEGAADLIRYLYDKQYFLYIITNGFKEVQEKKLELTGIRSYFKKVFISEDIKAQKPSREIFEYALKSSNARKKESLMIGDSWDVDIEGARLIGIDQVFFSSKTEDNPPTPFLNGSTKKSTTYTFIINHLTQLFSML